jgi:hypothetical protein
MVPSTIVARKFGMSSGYTSGKLYGPFRTSFVHDQERKSTRFEQVSGTGIEMRLATGWLGSYLWSL